MVIRTQDENAIYDLNKMASVFANNDGKVYTTNYSGELASLLGEYESYDRAVEIVEEIYALFDTQRRYDMPVM